MSDEAAKAARGSATVVLAGGLEQAARLVVTATLARRLGPEAFGAYAVAITVALSLGTFASLGQQPAVVRYGAREGDPGARRRAFGAALAIALVGGSVAALATRVVADFVPAGAALAAVAPGVAITAALYVVLGALRAGGEVGRAAAAHQLGLPLTMAALVLLWPGELGAVGAARMHVAATAAALAFAALPALRRIGLAAASPAELRAHLAYGLPQGFAETLLRTAVWLDVLVLAAIGTLDQVGSYRVAASVASLAALPVMAHQIAFSPVVAAGLHAGRPATVAAAARDLGRWTLVIAGGPLLAVWIAPEVVLWPFTDAYASSAGPLRVLLAGQALQVMCAAAGPVVAMSRRPRLELVNGVAAVGLALTLHLLLVPRFGAMGAAVASASGLGAWSVARTVEARLLLGASVIDRPTLALAGLAVSLAGAAHVIGVDAASRLALGPVVAIVYAAVAWRLLPAPDRTWATGVVAASLRRVRG